MAEDFLFCGSSALLLLIANLFPGYWYFSFIALLPFLWQIREATARRGLRLGLLLGLTFWVFSSLDAITIAFWATSVKIVCGTILFALWGWIVGLARRRLGFNPVIVAGLWVFFELALTKLGYTTGLLAHSTPSVSFGLKLITLFGLGVISFAVVLLNVALIEVVLYSLLLLKSSSADFSSAEELIVLIENPILFIEDFLFVPGYRGPPRQA